MTRIPSLPSASGAAPRRARGRLRFVVAAAAGVLLAACAAVGPEYGSAPPVDTGAGWIRPMPPAAGGAPSELARWWAALGDPVLDRLIDSALAANLDLRQAGARIDEARALRDRAAGKQAPVAGVAASVNRRRQSENGPLPVGVIPGLEVTQTIYDAGFDAAWEPDLFGANRRALQGAGARLQAVEIEAQGVRMRIVAEVARTWFSARGASLELRAQTAAADALAQTLELARLRHAVGETAAAEADLAYAQWAAADAALPEIQARHRAAAFGLGILLGALPEKELGLLDATAAPQALPLLPVGQRADILRRRPDVLAAERRLAASTADIGVATAELFPRLSIGVGGGLQALSSGDWFDASSTRLSILPLISWRLFDGGRVRAEIRAREAGQQQAALAYEQAVLAALGDAERTLSDYAAGLDTLHRRLTALQAAQNNQDRAQERFVAGDITRVELLAAEHLRLEAQSAAVRAHTAAALQMVALYKALGGGWDAAAAANPPVSPSVAAPPVAPVAPAAPLAAVASPAPGPATRGGAVSSR